MSEAPASDIERHEPGPGRPRLARAALVVASVAVALACAEVALRVRDIAPAVSRLARGRYRLSANPLLGFEPVPERIVEEGSGPMEDFVGASNSLGFRDGEHALPKPPGVQRIIVLGDSVGAGLRVERTADVFPAILERTLRAQGRALEVLNLSVHGYNTQQEVEMLVERGLQFSPDVVLVAYTLSDRERLDGNIMETLLHEHYGLASASGWRASPWVVRSALLRTLAYRVFPARRQAQPAQSEAEIERALAAVSGDTVAPSFARLRQLSQQHGFRVLVAAFPYLVRNARVYPYGAEHVFVRRLSRANGFHYCELLGALRKCAGGTSFAAVRADWAHLNELGHACVGRALAAAVQPALDGLPPVRKAKKASPP